MFYIGFEVEAGAPPVSVGIVLLENRVSCDITLLQSLHGMNPSALFKCLPEVAALKLFIEAACKFFNADNGFRWMVMQKTGLSQFFCLWI